MENHNIIYEHLIAAATRPSVCASLRSIRTNKHFCVPSNETANMEHYSEGRAVETERANKRHKTYLLVCHGINSLLRFVE